MIKLRKLPIMYLRYVNAAIARKAKTIILKARGREYFISFLWDAAKHKIDLPKDLLVEVSQLKKHKKEERLLNGNLLVSIVYDMRELMAVYQKHLPNRKFSL